MFLKGSKVSKRDHRNTCQYSIVYYAVNMAAYLEVTFFNVTALVNAEKHFPPRTPRRWNLIAECAQKLSATCHQCSHTLSDVSAAITNEATMVLGQSTQRGTPVKFECSADHCKQLFILLNSSYKEIVTIADDHETAL